MSKIVVLTFDNTDERNKFMGQLSDGWGENVVDLEWDWESGVEFVDCDVFHVTNTWDYDE